MSLASLLDGLSEVRSAVIGDHAGEALETLGEVDGEATAAIMALASRMLINIGSRLGLGDLLKLHVKGPASASLATVREDAIVAVQLDPGKPFAATEKRLEQAEWMKAGDMMVFLLPNEEEEAEAEAGAAAPALSAAGDASAGKEVDVPDPFVEKKWRRSTSGGKDSPGKNGSRS